MAHIAKYKKTAVGHMLAHYRRDRASLERDNVDSSRTFDSYRLTLAPGASEPAKDALLMPSWAERPAGDMPAWNTVEERLRAVDAAAKARGGRATRRDAVVMADIVVTLPEDVRAGDEGRFFSATYAFLARTLGAENMLGGFVHRDEVRKDGTPVRDHIHVPFTPILDGSFNFKKMCPRSFYQNLHRGLGRALEDELGYHVSIELGEGKKAEKALSSIPHDELSAARAAIIEPARAQAAEMAALAAKHEQAARRAQKAAASASERARGLESASDALEAELEAKQAEKAALEAEIAAETARLESVRRTRTAFESGELRARSERSRKRANELKPQVRSAKAEVARLDERVGKLESGVGRLRGRMERLRARIEAARTALAGLKDQAKTRVQTVTRAPSRRVDHRPTR